MLMTLTYFIDKLIIEDEEWKELIVEIEKNY